MQEEIWKDIPNYEGLYQVSNLGRVKSLKFNKEKLLKLYKDNYGYLRVNLSKNGKQKLLKVHQLVSVVFLKHKPNGYSVVVDHIDNNPLNNNVNNLQLVSHRKNLSKDKKGSSKYTGVRYHKQNKKWVSSIYVKGKHKHLGSFTNELDAAKAYNKYLCMLEDDINSNY